MINKQNILVTLYKKLIKILSQKTIKQVILYIFFGGIATIVDMYLLFVLTNYMQIHYLISAFISYFCGMITNYSFNKKNNFNNCDKRIFRQFIKFSFVALIGLGLNQLILFTLVSFFGLWYMIAKIFSVLIVTTWSYLGHRNITFNDKI
jgi:putative flippase GtrA